MLILQHLALGFVYSVGTFKRHGGLPSGVPGFLNQSEQRQPFSLSVLLFRVRPTASPKVWSSVWDKNILSALTANWKAIERVLLLQCFHKYIVNIFHSGKFSTKIQFSYTAIHAAGTGRWNDPEMNKKIIVYNFERPTVPDRHTQPGG